MSTLSLDSNDEAEQPAQATGRALITGAASGIGRAFAEALARRKESLVLVGRNLAALESLAAQLAETCGIAVDCIAADLSDRDAAPRILQQCEQNRIDVATLINCAGLGLRTSLLRQSAESVREMLDVNIHAVVELTRLFLPAMIKRRQGMILNVSSIAAFELMPKWAVYGGTKAFVQSFTESLRQEVAGTGVYVAALCPGITRTPFLHAAGLDDSEIPDTAQTAEEVVAEALRGMDRRLPLIVTGRGNRLRIHAQRASVRKLIQMIRQGMRMLRLSA